jgi:hypothetical protein
MQEMPRQSQKGGRGVHEEISPAAKGRNQTKIITSMDLNLHYVAEIRVEPIQKEEGYEVRKIVFTSDEQDGGKEFGVTCFTRTNGGSSLKIKAVEEREI